MMTIVAGSRGQLTKKTQRGKVWKKTNQWFFCASCVKLVYFREFKCRFDFDAEIRCGCGEVLCKAPSRICEEAKKQYPHFKEPRKAGGGKDWYSSVYLESPLWKAIRRRVLDRDKETCAKCGKRANTVHHKEYTEAVMNGFCDEVLVSLCFSCHRFIEFFDDGKKCTLDQANARLLMK